MLVSPVISDIFKTDGKVAYNFNLKEAILLSQQTEQFCFGNQRLNLLRFCPNRFGDLKFRV